MSTALIVHGHFYQPPRESPWTEALEREISAAPHHDWNERIHQECYRSNAFSRILDGYGHIDRVLNNYELISFNFGPTLLSWIERHHPVTYHRIIEADQKSVRMRDGHGNAIAQAYNHTILPLATARDRLTQIRWGLFDFRYRFGRDADGIWLPETAADDATLDALIDQGLKFTILSPHQADRVRMLEGRKSRPPGASGSGSSRPASSAGTPWRDVSDGSIDTSHAYRYWHKDGSGRSLALFFYDAGLALSVAFEGLLASSQGLIDRMKRASQGGLVNMATDGESYGHHFHFGDRTLAYALSVEAPNQGFRLTNYARFLAEHPPRWEVEIKKGGTAWSCAHGIGRWSKDCGCHTGGKEGWNQAWRGPLRVALDQLRAEAGEIFEAEGSALFGDPWAARDSYIEVILDRARTAAFLDRHGRASLEASARVRARALLELERCSQLMYTSCGWFFSDPSGIETIQILKYAARALELIEQVRGAGATRSRFLERLGDGRSNVKEAGTMADIFRSSVEPAQVRPARVAAHLAVSGLLEEDKNEAGIAGGFRYGTANVRRAQHGRISFLAGQVDLESETTGHTETLAVSALHIGGADVYCAVQPLAVADSTRFAVQMEALFEAFPGASLPALLRKVEEIFGPEQFGLTQVLPEERERIGGLVLRDLVARFSQEYDALYDDHWRTLELLKNAGFDLPLELRAAAEITLGRRLGRAILQALPSQDPSDYQEALAIAEQVKSRKLVVELDDSSRRFSDLIYDSIQSIVAQPVARRFESTIALIDLSQRLGLTPRLAGAQEALFLHADRAWPEAPLRELARLLGFTADAFAPR